MVIRASVLLLLLLGLVLPAQGQSHAGHAAPPPAAAGRISLGASAAFSADGTLWGVASQDGHVVWRKSNDRGASWSEPRLINSEPEAIAADGDARPKIAVGRDGVLFVSWTRPLALPYTGEVRFARSLDGGEHWSAVRTVHRDRQVITHRFDAMAVDPDGVLFVAWIDKRDQAKAKAEGSDYRGAAVYFAVSEDDGASFRGDYRLAEHSCECCRIALSPRPGGGVTALWRHVFTPNLRDHAIADLSVDGTVGEVRRATFDDWAVDACPHHGPSLARDADGRWHAVWFHLGADTPGVNYGRLDGRRVAAQRSVGNDSAAHADIVADGDRLLVTWNEFDGSRMRLRAMRSDDAGATWHVSELADTGDMADQPRALTYAGRFHVFWNTRERPWRVVAVP